MQSAFTMVEIALCLAIIGFALVAIIGVLPRGMTTQKDNREKTIINQDAVVWMNSIRNGAQGFNDLTNYVVAISNTVTRYVVVGTNVTLDSVLPNPDVWIWTPQFSTLNGIPTTPQLVLSNGFRIIGLLSTPKYEQTLSGFNSNYVVAAVRSLSGPAVEKVPQNNDVILENAFAYKLIVENIPYIPFDPGSTNYGQYSEPPDDLPLWIAASNRFHVIQILMTNSHDLRLQFRWPLLPNGEVGNGRVTYRAFTGGWLFQTNDLYVPNQPLFFFQPATYVP